MAILGDGKLGLLCAWVARLTGARVSLIGKHPAKLALAGEGIATHTLDDDPGPRPRLRRRGRLHRLADGPADGASALVRPCGTVVLKTTVAGTYTIDLAPIVIDEVRVIGSRCGPFPQAIAALASRQIDVRPLIGAEFDLDDAEAAFRAAAERGSSQGPDACQRRDRDRIGRQDASDCTDSRCGSSRPRIVMSMNSKYRYPWPYTLLP